MSATAVGKFLGTADETIDLEDVDMLMAATYMLKTGSRIEERCNKFSKLTTNVLSQCKTLLSTLDTVPNNKHHLTSWNQHLCSLIANVPASPPGLQEACNSCISQPGAELMDLRVQRQQLYKELQVRIEAARQSESCKSDFEDAKVAYLRINQRWKEWLASFLNSTRTLDVLQVLFSSWSNVWADTEAQLQRMLDEVILEASTLISQADTLPTLPASPLTPKPGWQNASLLNNSSMSSSSVSSSCSDNSSGGDRSQSISHTKKSWHKSKEGLKHVKKFVTKTVSQHYNGPPPSQEHLSNDQRALPSAVSEPVWGLIPPNLDKISLPTAPAVPEIGLLPPSPSFANTLGASLKGGFHHHHDKSRSSGDVTYDAIRAVFKQSYTIMATAEKQFIGVEKAVCDLGRPVAKIQEAYHKPPNILALSLHRTEPALNHIIHAVEAAKESWHTVLSRSNATNIFDELDKVNTMHSKFSSFRTKSSTVIYPSEQQNDYQMSSLFCMELMKYYNNSLSHYLLPFYVAMFAALYSLSHHMQATLKRASDTILQIKATPLSREISCLSRSPEFFDVYVGYVMLDSMPLVNKIESRLTGDARSLHVRVAINWGTPLIGCQGYELLMKDGKKYSRLHTVEIPEMDLWVGGNEVKKTRYVYVGQAQGNETHDGVTQWCNEYMAKHTTYNFAWENCRTFVDAMLRQYVTHNPVWGSGYEKSPLEWIHKNTKKKLWCISKGTGSPTSVASDPSWESPSPDSGNAHFYPPVLAVDSPSSA